MYSFESNSLAVRIFLNVAKKTIQSVIIIVLAFYSQAVSGQGGLIILPKRLVFEGNKRSAKLSIANTTADTVKYAISVIEMKMMADGSFIEVKKSDSGQSYASDHLRIYPKTVSLGPNDWQTISVQLSNASKLPQGEHRSHIRFTPLATENIAPQPKSTSNLIKVKIIPVFAITAPVIIRIGENNTRAHFTNVSFTYDADSIPVLNATINRAGNMSTYGNISVIHISPEGFETHVAYLKGLAVYVPNSTRNLSLNLDKKVGVNFSVGSLRVVYTTFIEERPVKMAEYEIIIPEKQKINYR
jgi:hypothetical protein